MGKGHRRYNKSQKVEIIEQVWNESLTLSEASKIYRIPQRTLWDWGHIYLEECKEAFWVEHRGHTSAASGTQKGRKPKLDKKAEQYLISENQRLRMELDYLKNQES